MHISKVLLAAGAATLLSTAAFAGTLDDVRAKGFVQCGVSQGLPGFSNPDEQGNWTGIDVDVCRAVALLNAISKSGLPPFGPWC